MCIKPHLENAGNMLIVFQKCGTILVQPAVIVVLPVAKSVSMSHYFEWHVWEIGESND